MSIRSSEAQLASRFTQTTHAKPTPALDPVTNKLPSPLNVCVVGASRGIGAGIALAYAAALPASSTLVLAARGSSADELRAVEQQAQVLNRDMATVRLAVDITDSSSVAALAARLEADVHTLDILVLNSGYSGPVVLKVTDGAPRDFRHVFDVNVQGTYLVAHHVFPLLIASRGARMFIAVGSFAALLTKGHIANTAYCVSKMAQERVVEMLGEQFGGEQDGGVISVTVHPGAVLTEMVDATTPDSFRSYLTDDVGLCGAFCVWLSRERRMWLNGRLLSAKWDVDELLEKKDVVEGQDLLKLGLRTGDSSFV